MVIDSEQVLNNNHAQMRAEFSGFIPRSGASGPGFGQLLTCTKIGRIGMPVSGRALEPGSSGPTRARAASETVGGSKQ